MRIKQPYISNTCHYAFFPNSPCVFCCPFCTWFMNSILPIKWPSPFIFNIPLFTHLDIWSVFSVNLFTSLKGRTHTPPPETKKWLLRRTAMFVTSNKPFSLSLPYSIKFNISINSWRWAFSKADHKIFLNHHRQLWISNIYDLTGTVVKWIPRRGSKL